MSFDTLAPVYRLMERLAAGDKMQRCRTAFLENIPPPQHILTLGEGHGPFLVACRQRFPEARITCVDSSAAMLAEARSSLIAQSLDDQRVHFMKCDILTWTPPRAEFDLIATHFFLDCFRADQLEVIMPRIANAAAEGASWLLADFQVAAQGWRRTRSKVILAMLYAFFRTFTRLPAKTLASPDPFLKTSGLRLHRRIEIEWGLLKSEWWMCA